MKKVLIFGTLGIQVLGLALNIWAIRNPEKYGEMNGKILKGMASVFEED